MRTKRGIIWIAGGVILGVVAMWGAGVIEGYEGTYEVRPEIRPEIRLPENRTDAARAIDAYERLMERYMTITERNLNGLGADLKEVLKRLDSIEGKLDGLLVRAARIEKALGIEPAKKPIVEKLRHKVVEPNMPLLKSAGEKEVR